LQRLLEAASMGLLGLRQRLKPIGNLGEALIARRAGHAGYISVYSWVSPAIAAFKFNSVVPIG